MYFNSLFSYGLYMSLELENAESWIAVLFSHGAAMEYYERTEFCQSDAFFRELEERDHSQRFVCMN